LPADSRSIIFRIDDIYVAPDSMTCSAAPGASNGVDVLDTLTAELTALEQQGAILQLDLGAVADFEFSQTFGANAETALLTRFNNVDGIFSEQLGIQISVAQLDVFVGADDPFTESDAEGLLDELALYRGATPAQDAQGLTHLFTGRNLDGSTAGIAYVGAVCSTKPPFESLKRSYGVGLSEGRRGAVMDSLIAAHEIGHNFGAPHDAEAGSPCEATAPIFLMAPSIKGTDQFSTCSIEQMQAEIATASCLTPIGGPDLALSEDEPNASALVGVSFDYSLLVTNLGVAAATGTRVSANLEDGLTVEAASASAGSCTIAGQSIACDIGEIGGGSIRSVTFTLRAAAVGTFAIAANAAADDDSNAANNSAGGTIDVRPAVDLVLSGNPGAVLASAQTTLAASLNNAADFGANAVTVSIALSSGLRPDAVTLAGIACSISAQTVTCPVQSLGARASAALTLTITGMAAGTQQVALGASSVEAELAPGDNDLVLQVDVTEPAVAQSGGGGGAAGWPSLLALGLMLIAAKRPRPRPRS
jgi:hypothetical protein